MWFDRNGRLLRKDDTGIDTEKCLALAATASAAHLVYRLPGEAGFSPVKHMPCALDTGGGRFLELYPSPEPEAYHGLLMLRQETTLPLSASALLLGRSDAQADAAQPDLPLELLDHPRNLRWADGKGPKGAKLNALNLSRRHVSLRLVGGKLELGMAEGKMPVYVLDREARLMRAVQPGDRKTALLEPDELFVVGNYLLRYHEEKPQAFTGQATVLRARSRKSG
jgi:hypothetical protein